MKGLQRACLLSQGCQTGIPEGMSGIARREEHVEQKNNKKQNVCNHNQKL